jgi:hypothetical protein
MSVKEIKLLASELKKYDDAYYNSGTSTVTDDYYDVIKEKLRKLDPNLTTSASVQDDLSLLSAFRRRLQAIMVYWSVGNSSWPCTVANHTQVTSYRSASPRPLFHRRDIQCICTPEATFSRS